MNKRILIILLACSGLIPASAQTLFTYGKYAVDAKDFLKAYSKNNTRPVVNKAKAISDYLDLYINSRLKIREAYERRYDTLPLINKEVENLRIQIAENYMNDPLAIGRFQAEVFDRSQKDIRVAHIFIAARNKAGIADTTAALTKKDEVMRRLQKGEDFAAVAREYSDDTSARTTGGELGYITVLTLPYEFENAIYTAPVGKYSSPVLSKAGYHIFKNLGERKAAGKITAQQILVAMPPGVDDAAKKRIALFADSLYKRVLAGDDFSKLASAFSNDYVTAANGGTMTDVSVGHYDPAFEKALWSLPKDGAVSKPFLSRHGWHILKRISVKPVVTDTNNLTNKAQLLTLIMADSRTRSSRDFIYKKVMEKAGLKKKTYDDGALWALSDSMLDGRPMKEIGRKITPATVLFTIGDSIYTTASWLAYASAYRFNQDGSGAKPNEQVREEFIKFAMYNYYRDHLEEFNEDFRNQMLEFKDGNIFFEIMQQEVWNKAQMDTVSLYALYEKNKKIYIWTQCADAVLFFCSDEATAKKVAEEVKKNPADWRKITEMNSEKVVADSARYEWSQIPNLSKMVPKAGMITAPLTNNYDKTASFAYIIQAYMQPVQRTFSEAKGLVVNDYQTILETQWTEALKKKYPVVIDQKVLAEISK